MIPQCFTPMFHGPATCTNVARKAADLRKECAPYSPSSGGSLPHVRRSTPVPISPGTGKTTEGGGPNA